MRFIQKWLSLYGNMPLGKTDCDWILIIDDDAMIAADYIEQLQKAILKTNYLAYSGAEQCIFKGKAFCHTAHQTVTVNK